MWLKNMRYAVIGWLLMASTCVQGQGLFDDTLTMDPLDSLMFQSFNIYEDLEKQLIPLDSIIFIAEYGNPQILYQEALIQVSEFNIKNTKSLWMNTLYAFGNWSFGDQQLTLADVGGTTVDSRITNGYVAGVGLRIPLYEFVGRRNIVNQIRAERDAAVYMRDLMSQNLNRQIIDEYYEMVTSQKTMMIAARDALAQQLNVDIAEKGVLSGQVNMADYARYVTMNTAATMRYEDEKKDFYKQFKKFELLVGVTMIELKR